MLANVGWVERSATQQQVIAIDINFGKYTSCNRDTALKSQKVRSQIL
ncbi:MAG: hypothetical protein F6K14_09565 [Symploca sp. SIO2C1]|nr:hypothetical protein [Symploca sp. SIO2C1]